MIVKVFNEVPLQPFKPTGDVYGTSKLDNISSMQIGVGTRSFKAGEEGIFLGGKTFATAPFSVDMQGNLIATSSGFGKHFVSTLAWTATDYNTATWAEGTIKTSDSTIYSITAGNTGNIAALTYIYLDPATSITVLQKTTTAATAMGTNKILIAVVQLGTSGSGCIIDVVSSYGTTIDGDRIVTGKIESHDGKTYFDLDIGTILISDASNSRFLAGYQLNGFP